VLGSTQDIPHRSCPGGHPVTHIPLAPSHTGVPPAQTRPHAPQCDALINAVSQPLAALPSQFP
jgi:hypothetical protein